MTTYATQRPIDLAQLGAELGTDALSMSDDGTERTIECHDETVTQATLQAAVDAHTPEPPPPTAEEQLANLQAQVTEQDATINELIIITLGG